jgi:hypothetical protein
MNDPSFCKIFYINAGISDALTASSFLKNAVAVRKSYPYFAYFTGAEIICELSILCSQKATLFQSFVNAVLGAFQIRLPLTSIPIKFPVPIQSSQAKCIFAFAAGQVQV